MKRRSPLQRLMALSLVLCMMLGLAGCPSPDPNGGGTTTPTGTTPSGQNPDAPTPTEYANPTPLPDTGDALGSGAAILFPATVTEDGAIDKAASGMNSILRGGLEGNTYRVTDGAAVTLSGANGRIYSGDGGAILSPAGFVFKNCKNCTFEKITFVGPVRLEGSEGVVFEDCFFVGGEGVALTTDAATTGTRVTDSRLEGKIALDNKGGDSYLLDSYVAFTESGVIDTAAGLGIYVAGSRFEGSGQALAISSESAEVRRSSFTVGKTDVAVSVTGGANLLFAENVVKDAQTAVALRGATNGTLVRNSLISVDVRNTRHMSIADNALGGKLYAYDNAYILANGNRYPTDAYNHVTEGDGNTHPMGDSLLDVDQRLSYGADESLLHQVEKDRFTYMEKKEYVRTPDGDVRVSDYILSLAETEAYVIVAPGHYSSYSAIALRAKHKDTVIYAYGVFAERVASGATDNNGTALYYGIDNNGCDNVTIKGLTIGFEREATAQVYAVEVDDAAYRVRVIAGAGLANELGSLSEWYESGVLFAYREGDYKPYADLKYQTASLNDDGSIWVSFDRSNAAQRNSFGQVRVGDVFSSRARVNGQYYHNVRTEDASGVVYEDVVNYAHSNSFAFYEYGAEAVVYNRVVDTSRPGKIIDEETYNHYKSLESAWGISFDVYKDGDYYRGCPMRAGSVDGIHTHTSVRGSQVTSSLFENLLDDGTNQKSSYSRLSHIVDNGDGTATIVFKGTFSGVYDTDPSAKITPNQWGRFPVEGDKVFLYSLGSGETICEGVALTGTVADGTRTTIWNTEVRCYKFTVSADTVNWDIYRSFVSRGVMDSPNDRLSVLDSSDLTYKIAVDNASYLSTGVRFDNTVVRNTRSRGLLIKTSDVKITNCTIVNTGSPGILVNNEGEWGESGRSRGVDIKNNLFIYTGYRSTTPKSSAIWVSGVGAESGLALPLDKLLTGDILIEGNVMQNRPGVYAISLWGADNVTIKDNDFGRKVDMEGLERPTYTLQIEQCKNVTVSGNTFPRGDIAKTATVTASRYTGLGGTDLGDAFPDSPNA